MAKIERNFPKITDEQLDKLRETIGVKRPAPFEPWVTELTRDNIRHYAHGIGDDNPLWCDPEYGKNTKYGDIIGVPTMLFACTRGSTGFAGLPGIHAMYSGCDFTWRHPIRRNDVFRSEICLHDMIEHKTRFAGRSIQQIFRIDFHNQDDIHVGTLDWHAFRTERDAAREKGKKYDRQETRKVWTEEELQKIFDLYEQEEIRGANPRYWEDVKEGEALPTMVKGPMTVTGFLSFVQGWGGMFIRANKLFYKQSKKVPALAIRDDYGTPDCPEAVHWRDDFAQMVGAPAAYDYGPERCSWLGHAITNWIGDDGMMQGLSAQLRRHNPVGDALFINGSVARKFEEDGEKRVEFILRGENQNGELSISGTAVAALPSRNP